MSINVSKLNVMLTGSSEGFTGSMADGSKAVDQLASHTHSAAGIVAGAAAVIGAALSVASFAELTKSTMESITATSRFAQSIGITTEALSKLQYGAKLTGVANEDLQSGLVKLAKNLQAAAGGAGPAASALNALGLTAKDLQNMPTDQAIGKIADALNDVPNTGQRAALAMELFGKGAVSIIPLLSEGSEGIAKMGEEAQKMHVSFNAIDAAKIEAANRSIARVQEAFQGVFNVISIQVAPYLEAMANKLVQIGTNGQGAAGIVISGMKMMAEGIAYVADITNIGSAAWQFFKAEVIAACNSSVSDLAMLADALDLLLVKLHQAPTNLGQTLHAMSDSLATDSDAALTKAGQAWRDFISGKNQKAVTRFFDEIQAGSQKAAEATAAAKEKLSGMALDINTHTEEIAKKLDELQKKVGQFGFTDGQKMVDDLAKLGASEEQLQQAGALQQQLDTMEALKKAQDQMGEDAKKAWEDAASPLDKYNDELNKLDVLLKQGLIDQNTYDRDKKKARDTLEKSETQKEPPKLLQAGSQEASRFVAQIQAQQKAHGHTDTLIRQSKQANDYLQKIIDNTGALANLGVLSLN